MKIQNLVPVAGIALALMACNPTTPTTPAAPATGSTPSTAQTPDDSMIAKAIKRNMGGNLTIGDSNLRMRDGKLILMQDDQERGTVAMDGSLEVDGKPVTLNASQRAVTVKLYQQSQQLKQDAIAIAGDAANVASSAVSEGMKFAVGSILRGDNTAKEAEFERKIEAAVRQNIKPGAIRICNTSNQMEETKRQLASIVPEYKPYYVAKKACDVAEMEKEFANGGIGDAATSADLPASTK